MKRIVPFLSQGMLVLGGLMILAGLGWAIWLRIKAPPAPVITDAGAVVLAVTAALKPSGLPATAIPSPNPQTSPPPPAAGPTPAFLPGFPLEEQLPAPIPSSPAATPLPATRTRAPSATPSPRAEEPPTRIVAPAIELDAAVEPMSWKLVDQGGTIVSEWVVPKKAAGWHVNSALPGQGDNVVLSGHHNIEGKVFRYVVDLEPGDEITVYAGSLAYRYIVAEKYILQEAGMPTHVRQKNAQWIMPTCDERLTLVTCWPYEWPGNSHRVIVVARPPPYFEPLVEGLDEEGSK